MFALLAVNLAGLVLVLILVRVLVRLNVAPCTCPDSMQGKVVVVTGANGGIGYETARELARRGARVLLACRSETRAAAARARLLLDVPGAAVQCRRLDLASLASVREFAAELLRTERRLDVLINNAGAVGLGNRHTRDGIVEEMQVNHFGPFLLTLLLLPLLKRTSGSRIVNVSSIVHYVGVINTDTMNREGYYGDVRTYANSKLCNVVFTMELARRLQGSGVHAHCLHPGVAWTEVAEDTGPILKMLFRLACFVIGRTIREAAQSSVHVAVSARAGACTGRYYVERSARNWALLLWVTDPAVGARLWQYSEKLVGYKCDGS